MGYFTRDQVRSLLATRQAIERIYEDENAEKRRLAALRARVFAAPSLSERSSKKQGSKGTGSNASGLAKEAADLRRSMDEVARAQAALRARAAAAGLSNRSASLRAALQQIQRRAQPLELRGSLESGGENLHKTPQTPEAPDPKALERLEAQEAKFAEKKRINRRRLEDIHLRHMMQENAALSAEKPNLPTQRSPTRSVSRHTSSRKSPIEKIWDGGVFPKQAFGKNLWKGNFSRGNFSGGRGGVSGAIWNGADLIRGIQKRGVADALKAMMKQRLMGMAKTMLLGSWWR